MVILPAIDLKHGRCVRLYKGDFNTVHTVSDNAVDTAEEFFNAGAGFVHMVDLDGALGGKGKNRDTVRSVCRAMGERLKVELGGGIRGMKDIEDVFELGVYRVVIGSAAVSDPDFVAAAVKRYGERVAVGIDALNGIVRVSGWTENSGIKAVDLAVKMEGLGVKTIIYTDIDTDGMLQGPAIDKLKELRSKVDCDIIASGGISRLEDITALKAIDMNGAIVGKAIYTGDINLADAIAEARQG